MRLHYSVFAADIPEELAERAFSGTSHYPEARGRAAIDDYARTLLGDYQPFEGETNPDFIEAFSEYRDGYRKRYIAWLAARGRCVSTLVTGPAKFPTTRARKASDAADARDREMADFRTRALKRLRAIVRPSEAPIASGDPDAVEKLLAKIAEGELFRERAKAINTAIRRARRENYNPFTALRAIGCPAEEATKHTTPDAFGNLGVAPYAVRNNSAEIRRLEKRLAQVRAAHSAPNTDTYYPGITVMDAPAENRVRIRFADGKPSAAIRSRLKSNGFRWAPTVAGGVWQAFRNQYAIRFAERFARGEP